MSQSASTAPDVLYEDTFLVNSDVAAGYLAPLNSYLSKWSGWNQYSRCRQGRRQGRQRPDLRCLHGHRHPWPVVQQELLKKAGIAVSLASHELG